MPQKHHRTTKARESGRTTRQMIRSIQIRGFRGIGTLQIEPLAPITMFTGHNGAGKTTMLEAALALYGRQNPLWVNNLQVHRGFGSITSKGLNYTGLFARFADVGKAVISATIEGGKSCRVELERADTESAADSDESSSSSTESVRSAPLICRAYEGKKLVRTSHIALDVTPTRVRLRAIGGGKHDFQSIVMHPSDRAAGDEEEERFGEAVLLGQSESIVRGLRLLDDGVTDVQFVKTPIGEYFVVKRNGEIVPLGLLGGGVNSLFRFLVNMNFSRGGFMGIDEVENGFHHSKLDRLFGFLFEAARRTNTQLFMTTHSAEAVAAAIRAAHETLRDDFAVVHLSRDKSNVVSGRVLREREALTSIDLGHDLR